jgi:transposase-like protein
MDETYIKVKGQWRYLYRAVDKHGQTIDFLLTEQRDEAAAKQEYRKFKRHFRTVPPATRLRQGPPVVRAMAPAAACRSGSQRG